MKKRAEIYKFPNPTDRTAELIKRYRLQVIVHSCLYYALDENIWDDHKFDMVCKDLVGLMRDHPEAYSDRFDEYFEDWDGSSGYHFPHRDPWVLGAAQNLLRSKSYNDITKCSKKYVDKT
jgi:hypothetical protein